MRREDPLDAFLGVSAPVVRLKEDVRTYAASDIPVLITGETGTGKELLARAIHALSSRQSASFLPINCSAFATHLAESELFGHVAGAFSGAIREKRGLVEIADHGTLFLDEIGELAPELQPKILRLLQFGSFYPVGSENERSVGLRLVSATNRPLVQSGEHPPGIYGLRRDLLYRLNAVHLHIPPLRERPEDIPLLFEDRALQRGVELPPLTKDAQRLLTSYSFPGNVRELQSMVDKLLLHMERRPEAPCSVTTEVLERLLHPEVSNGCIDGEAMDSPIDESGDGVPSSRGGPSFSLESYLRQIERRIIAKTLEGCAGNISQTARALGLSRQGLKKKMRRYEL